MGTRISKYHIVVGSVPRARAHGSSTNRRRAPASGIMLLHVVLVDLWSTHGAECYVKIGKWARLVNGKVQVPYRFTVASYLGLDCF